MTEKLNNYQKGKAKAIEKAQFWQEYFAEVSMSWGEVAFWQGYFTKLAKRYGLVKEFKENAII